MSLHLFSTALYNDALSPADKYRSFCEFKVYYDQLCDDILKGATYTDDQLAQHIFKSKWKPDQEDMIVKKLLFAAKNTLNRYDKLLNEANFAQFNFVLRMLAFDMFGIIQYGEKTYRNTDLNFDMGSRPDQNAREIFDVSEGMLHIGTIDPLTAYLREVVPVSIFLLRQTIEVFGKRALGFHSITDSNGNRSRSVSTQIAWTFIKSERLKSAPRIRLQAHIDTIKKVEEWTNAYVHTGFIPEIFLIENAIHFVKLLIYPMNNVRDYKNRIKYYGTTQIKEYNAVKVDFEEFINNKPKRNWLVRQWRKLLVFLRLKNKPKQLIVNWYNENQVDATILSI